MGLRTPCDRIEPWAKSMRPPAHTVARALLHIAIGIERQCYRNTQYLPAVADFIVAVVCARSSAPRLAIFSLIILRTLRMLCAPVFVVAVAWFVYASVCIILHYIACNYETFLFN